MQSSKKVLIALLVAVIIILLVVLEYLIFQHKTPAPAPIPATLATTTQKVVSATDSAAIAYWVLQNDLNQHGGPACYDVNNTSDGTIITYSFTKEYNNTNCPYDPNATTTIPLIEVNIKTGAAYTQEAKASMSRRHQSLPGVRRRQPDRQMAGLHEQRFRLHHAGAAGLDDVAGTGKHRRRRMFRRLYSFPTVKSAFSIRAGEPGHLGPSRWKQNAEPHYRRSARRRLTTATSSALRDTDCSFMRIQINHNDNWYGIDPRATLPTIPTYTRTSCRRSNSLTEASAL